MKTINDNFTSFAGPVALQVWIDDEQKQIAVYCDGYQLLGQSYDGWTNRIRIQPLVRAHPDWLLSMTPMGQDYTIRQAHLSRLIIDSFRLSQ